MHANASFTIKEWEEGTFSDVQGAGKLTRAVVKKHYTGELEGEGALQYLMAYRTDGSADFVGLERITGKLGERVGSFVLRHAGTYAHDKMHQETTVVEGSGSGGLTGLRGRSEMVAGHQKEYPFTLDYEFG